MLTTTTLFDAKNIQRNLRPVRLLRITGESTTWYLSDRAINVLDGSSNVYAHYPLVMSWGDLNQQLDLWRRSSAVANTSIVLNNQPYKGNASNRVRLSDEMWSAKIFNYSAKIYFGYEGLLIEDYLLLFDGLVKVPESIGINEIVLGLAETSTKYYQLIPTTGVSKASYLSLPDISIGKRLPVIYGTFSIPDGTKGQVAEGVWISPRKAVLAGHVIKSVSEIWVQDPNLDKIVRLDSTAYTITLNDSGLATVLFDEWDIIAHGYIYPSASSRDYQVPALFTGFAETTEFAHDEFADTYLAGKIGKEVENRTGYFFGLFDEIPIHAGAISAVYLEILYKILDVGLQAGADTFHLSFEAGGTPSVMNLRQSAGTATGGGNDYLDDSGQAWATNEWAGFTLEQLGTAETAVVASNTATRITIVGTWSSNPGAGTNYSLYGKYRSLDITTYWNTQTLGWETLARRADNSLKNYIHIHYHGNEQTEDRDFVKIYGLRLHIKYKFADPPNTSTTHALDPATRVQWVVRQMLREDFVVPGVRQDMLTNTGYGLNVFCESTGRLFGSWIDAVGRSNAYNENDLISHPVYIIESILRDVLSVNTLEIDAASFDTAATDVGSYVASVALYDGVEAASVIESICSQYKLFLWYSAEGKFKIKCHKATFSAADSLYAQDIEQISIKKDSGEKLVNKISIDYFYSRPRQSYLKRLNSINATSQTDYKTVGELIKPCNCIVADATATWLKDHYTGTSGYWKELNDTVKISLTGWHKIKYEIGDAIALDSGVDSIMKIFNAGWAGKVFLIIDKSVTSNGMELTMQRVT